MPPGDHYLNGESLVESCSPDYRSVLTSPHLRERSGPLEITCKPARLLPILSQ